MKAILIILIYIFSALGIYSQTTYIWTGAVNSSFSTAGNWQPTRQVGLISDILIFNTGTTLNITNVNQVTVGQIVVMNNTQLRLTPSTGNPKVISIQGDGDSPYNGSMGEQENIADVKYNEYMNTESQEPQDIATMKYNEYKTTDEITAANDIATQKYTEYKNPPTQGMGDIKSVEEEFDFNSNDDLSIDSTSSLTLMGNNPKLSIYLKQHATAAIYGSLVLTGETAHNINSFDTYAINFKRGASLVQSCPGNVFTSIGTNNAAVFEDGSTLEINHAGALDPFAIEAPSSKVSFYANSNLKFGISNSNALKLKGRQFPNLIIGNNCNINIIENITADVQINDLVIYTGGKLYISNISAEVTPNLNLKGNLSINGELHFPQIEGSFVTLNMNGTTEQSISGSGIIDINAGVKSFHIYNDIILNRDLTVLCIVIHHNGNINTNGHNFRIYSQYSSREQLPVGVIILSPDKKSESLGNNKGNTNNLQSAGNNSSGIPESFSISQNYPNPFNPSTKIDFALPKPSLVKISVYDLTGQEIVTLVNGSKDAGFNTLDFNGSNLASGIYFYRMNAESGNGQVYSKTMKMVLAK